MPPWFDGITSRRAGATTPLDPAPGRGARSGVSPHQPDRTAAAEVAHYLDRPATAPGAGAGAGAGAAQLTGREQQVLALVGRGLSNDDIARELTISMGTVKSHIGSLLAKLQARDRAQLVIAAYDHGLVHPRGG